MQIRVDDQTKDVLEAIAIKKHAPISRAVGSIVIDYVVHAYVRASKGLERTLSLIAKTEEFPEMSAELRELREWKADYEAQLTFFAPLLSKLGLSLLGVEELVE